MANKRRIVQLKRIFSLLTLILFSSGCVSSDDEYDPINFVPFSWRHQIEQKVPPPATGEPYYYQTNRLYNAYFNKSRRDLNTFLSAWHSEHQPVTDNEVKSYPDIVRHAYMILEAVYQIDSPLPVDFTNNIEKSVEYQLLQGGFSMK